jgi:hypothetical protein
MKQEQEIDHQLGLRSTASGPKGGDGCVLQHCRPALLPDSEVGTSADPPAGDWCWSTFAAMPEATARGRWKQEQIEHRHPPAGRLRVGVLPTHWDCAMEVRAPMDYLMMGLRLSTASGQGR